MQLGDLYFLIADCSSVVNTVVLKQEGPEFDSQQGLMEYDLMPQQINSLYYDSS